MPETSQHPLLPDQLRALAESMLNSNSAPFNKGHYLGMDALSVLFKLSNSPDSAADCLKILHEFQTHQIELELQHEQNEINLNDIEADLARYRQLYESAPMGYFSIDRDGRITQSNPAGATLLGSQCQELDGDLLENFLAHASRPLFNWHLKKLFSGSPGETCILQLIDSPDQEGMLRSVANLAPNGNEVFMTLLQAG